MSLTNVYFSKLNEHAVIPTKRLEDAGYDLYSVLSHPVILAPGETRLIPTGLCSSFSSDYVAVVKERGSTGSKGLGVRAGIIDSGYRGEWCVALTNHNAKPLVIGPDDVTLGDDVIHYPWSKAIAQFLFLPVPSLNIVEVEVEAIQASESERGRGALGSSGK